MPFQHQVFFEFLTAINCPSMCPTSSTYTSIQPKSINQKRRTSFTNICIQSYECCYWLPQKGQLSTKKTDTGHEESWCYWCYAFGQEKEVIHLSVSLRCLAWSTGQKREKIFITVLHNALHLSWKWSVELKQITATPSCDAYFYYLIETNVNHGFCRTKNNLGLGNYIFGLYEIKVWIFPKENGCIHGKIMPKYCQFIKRSL